MPESVDNVPPRRLPLGRRNLLLLAAGLATLAAGYGVLWSGYASPAAVLLVLGYCVLVPLALAL